MFRPPTHLSDELERTGQTVSVSTQFGQLTGGRALNGVAAWLEIPYALPPERFKDPVPLPSSYRYQDKKYIHESLYATQPDNDGQAGNGDPRNKLGLGNPTENPLFLNIVVPPSFPSKRNFPVKIYIHGGFLQFGSPHGLSGQAQHVAAEREEIYVNPGYRLSAFGFLASDEPVIPGNFGFKDQWVALEWVRDNIQVFGGDPNDIQLTGLSAGAHSVHQLLHHVSHLPPGIQSPFQSAMLQSNAIAINPKSLTELRPQYHALLQAVGLDPSMIESFSALSDPSKTPWERIVKEISQTLVAHGTYRATADGYFLPRYPSEMEWQKSGGFSKALRQKGVRSIIVGDLTEEWYLYSIAHPIYSPKDVAENLKRYYPDDVVTRLITWSGLFPQTSREDCIRIFGKIMSDCQVHLPVRMLHRDLQRKGFPVLRYQIRWTPPQYRPKGYVTHATDRPLWAFRRDILTEEQIPIARAWLNAISAATKMIENDGINPNPIDEVLSLKEDGIVSWMKDDRWQEMEHLEKIIDTRSGKQTKSNL